MGFLGLWTLEAGDSKSLTAGQHRGNKESQSRTDLDSNRAMIGTVTAAQEVAGCQ